MIFQVLSLRGKCPSTEFFSGPYFPVFALNTGKYGPEKTLSLGTFHAVFVFLKYIKIEGSCFKCRQKPICKTLLFQLSPFQLSALMRRRLQHLILEYHTKTFMQTSDICFLCNGLFFMIPYRYYSSKKNHKIRFYETFIFKI